MQQVYNKRVEVKGYSIFYREAGNIDSTVLLLLHGFPSSSHMFRNLIPILSKKYRIIAPDFLGFGFSEMPSREEFDYTFQNLTEHIISFLSEIGVGKFAMYVFDYGAPIGFRIAKDYPEKITAIISQNGNAYLEGLSENWMPVKKYWESKSREDRDALDSFVSFQFTKWQYEYGVSDSLLIPPEAYTLDYYFLSREDSKEIQLDLIKNYQSNIDLYPDFQLYFRKYQPPFIAIWGKNDPFFLPEGAQAFKKDLPKATIKLLDTGHFALETHSEEIANLIQDFLSEVEF